MDNEPFNLIDKPWIPVLMLDGNTQKVSLLDVFAKGQDMADLALNPYERIAITRLLIAIAMAALGKENLQDEMRWKQSRSLLCQATGNYLNIWHDRFNLYGKNAFMQPDELAADEKAKASCDKLFPHLASGNNPTLFDHLASTGNRIMADDRMAIGLLTYLNFSAGGQHAKCFWSAQETSVSVSLCPSREKSMLHTMILGDTLTTTIWLNLVTQDMADTLPETTLGRPIWEYENLSRKNVEGKGIEHTLLGRLVPLSRVIKLERNRPNCIMGEGLKYAQLPAAREVMGATLLKNDGKGNETIAYVSASSARQPWRDLQAILAQTEKTGTPVLQHLKSLRENEEFVIWTGGLVASQAKDEAVVEWTSRQTQALLTNEALLKYQNGIDGAERWSRKLRHATEEYAGAIKGFETQKKKPMEKASLAAPFSQPAQRYFWDQLSNQQPLLAAIAEGRANANLHQWLDHVKQASINAYEFACPKTSGRQVTAYVKGLKKLDDRKEQENVSD